VDTNLTSPIVGVKVLDPCRDLLNLYAVPIGIIWVSSNPIEDYGSCKHIFTTQYPDYPVFTVLPDTWDPLLAVILDQPAPPEALPYLFALCRSNIAEEGSLPDDLASWIDEIPLLDDRETITDNEWNYMISVWKEYSNLKLEQIKLKTTKLAGGGYGTVFEGKLTGTGTGQKFTKAVKVIELNKKELEASENRNLFKSLLREIDASEYIMPSGATIQFDGVCVHDDNNGSVKAFIVMPKAQGDLEKLVQNRAENRKQFNNNAIPEKRWQRNSLLSNEEVFMIALTVAKGILFMHNLGFVHRDIKPKNILIEAWLSKPSSIPGVFLADYGIARRLDPEGNTSYIVEGATLQNRYMDPTASQRTLDATADVYAFGLVL
jgi:hypothetical protein